jgi:predicted DNA-binding transcriptional regulator YafY
VELSYQDAAERLWHFTIRHAKIVPHEKRQYLDCWCEETAGNQDIPELQHNWSLRLDRIEDAALLPVKGEWRSHLDYVEVEMHLLRGLFFAYQAKPEDITSQQLPGDRRIKRVVRKITSTFWFQREVLQYGQDCIVVSPENVRDRIKQELLASYQNYNPPSVGLNNQ